jgi:uncharacterized Zn finger protein
MPKEKLPKLNESHIRKLASEESFKRGMRYYRSGAILEPIRQGMELRADCQGSQYEPYQVSVTLTEEDVGETFCTCPYNHGGICKHIVALLLTYAHKPQAFRIIQPMEEMLAQHSKEELITLIGEIVKREPGLMSLVELSVESRQGKPIDVEAYRRRVRRVLQHRSLDVIEWELQTLGDTANQLAKAGDWLNAGALYYALLAETVSHYDDELQGMDEEGDVAILLDEFAEGLSKCLKEGKPEGGIRRAWLEALLDAELTDIELGGIDLAPSARGAVLTHATDEEWAWIEKRVRVQIQTSSDWGREVLVEFLVERQAQKGWNEEGAALIRELGTPEQRAFLLVEEGRIDEAMRLMQHLLTDKPGLVTEFADALVEAGAEDAAVALVTAHVQSGGVFPWCTDWLAKYYRKRGDSRASLEWQQKTFLQRPSVDTFKTLREVSRKAGMWGQVHSDVLNALERKNQIGPLIEIALYEGDVARALELLPRLRVWGWRNYKREVAQAAEKDYPQEAIALYKEMVERAIGERQRSAYRQAAWDLKRVKALYERLDAQSDWDVYIQTLRMQYARFPALQDELRKVRL